MSKHILLVGFNKKNGDEFKSQLLKGSYTEVTNYYEDIPEEYRETGFYIPDSVVFLDTSEEVKNSVMQVQERFKSMRLSDVPCEYFDYIPEIMTPQECLNGFQVNKQLVSEVNKKVKLLFAASQDKNSLFSSGTLEEKAIIHTIADRYINASLNNEPASLKFFYSPCNIVLIQS